MKMKLAVSKFILGVLGLFLVNAMCAPWSSAQQPALPANVTASTATADIARRVYELEVTQAQTIESLKASNDYDRFLITMIGGLIALLVAIQGFATYVHLRREGRRDLAEKGGVEQVSKIMAVVQQTLEGRLKAEEKARTEAENTHEIVEKVHKDVSLINDFVSRYRLKLQNARNELEEKASRWARGVNRHDFRRMTNELNEFANQHNQLQTDENLLGDNGLSFSARVAYIRGIAEHYANHPESAKHLLSEVAAAQNAEGGETEVNLRQRVANAHYYLGLIELNFGDSKKAIGYFESTSYRDQHSVDPLTNIATAEAHVMANNADAARTLIQAVLQKLNEVAIREKRLPAAELRLQSRAKLIDANIVILGGEAGLEARVEQILDPVCRDDPQYYYASVTLAQITHKSGRLDEAKEKFVAAREAIVASNDLHTVREARSRILLLMVAAMCARHGREDIREADGYLDEADSLRADLPRIDNVICTVFSALSKLNETSETIHEHIQRIREGDVLLY